VKPCEWCDNTFQPKVTYQVYCSPECRTEATKIKIAERYVANQRRKRLSKPKICAGGCGKKLSIYNDDVLCNACNINKKELDKQMKQLKGFMNGKNTTDE